MDRQVIARGRYALLLGLFFGWLLSFPVYGPILGAIAGVRAMDPGPAVTSFLIAHAIGLFGFGLLGTRFSFQWTWFLLGALACAAGTLSFTGLSPILWSWAMGALGLLAALPVIVWTGRYPGSIPYACRGRTISVAQVTANLLLIAVGMGLRRWSPATMLVVAAAFLLATAAASGWFSRRLDSLPAAGAAATTPAPTKEELPATPLWQLACLIVLFDLAAGLVNQVVYPAQSGQSTLPMEVGLLAYVAFNALSGQSADKYDRRHLAVMGLVALGVSLFLGASLSTAFGLHAAQFLVQASYAPIDLFLWVTLADIAPKGKITSYFGLGLGLNVFSIYGGSMAGSRLTALFPGSSAVLIAGATLFLAVPLVTLAPVRMSALWAAVPAAHNEVSVLASYGLSYREREIALLLLDGASNDDLVARLRISPNTLKTHLRHIYQKTETGNRRELILKMTRHREPAPKAGRKTG